MLFILFIQKLINKINIRDKKLKDKKNAKVDKKFLDAMTRFTELSFRMCFFITKIYNN